MAILIPYFLLLIGVAGFGLAYYVWQKRSEPGALYFALFTLAIGWNCLFYGIQLLSSTLVGQFFWLHLRYIGDVLAFPALFLVILWYAGYEHWVKRYQYWLFVIPSLTLLLLYTNEFHHFYYQATWLDSTGAIPVLAKSNGPLYWLVMSYNEILMFSGTFLLSIHFFRVQRPYRLQVAIIWFGSIIPILSNTFYLLGWRVAGNVNPSYLLFSLTWLAFALGLYYFDILELRPIAHDVVMERGNVGVLLIDSRDRVVEINLKARNDLDCQVDKPAGLPLRQVHPFLAEWLEHNRPKEGTTSRELEIIPGMRVSTDQESDGRQAHTLQIEASPIRDQGRVNGWVILLWDITERIQAERRLQASEEKLRFVTENVVDVLFSLDDNLRITYASPSVIQFIGYSVQEALVMDINEILAPESQAEIGLHMQHVRANFAAGRWEIYVGRVDTLQLRHRRRDSSEFWGETSVSYVIDQDHHFAGIIGVARDITDRKETDRKMLEQQRALAALEEREYLARELHDNLGQVMGYIHLQVQTAAQQLRDDQVELCQATLQQLNEVSQDSYSDLREFLLGLRQKFSEAPDFFTALQKYTQDYSRAYGLPINLCCPDSLVTIRLDPSAEVHLLRIIQEALSNIRKHAHATKATIFFSRADGSTQVMIEDDGQGFDPDKQQTSAAENQAEGAFHFGMDIMGERARELGGNFQVFSAPGQGTRILVRLPDHHPQATSPRVSSLRVVIADDHPLFRDGLRNLLQARGVKVVGLAQNGREAVERALALQPDVVILDIQMPEMDGLEACRQIKAHAPGMRVLMLTMATNANTLFDAVRAGASGYLLKDLDADQFLDRLDALVRGETPIAPSMAGPLLQEFASHPEALDENEVLNARQQEVLALMAQNLTYAQIAQRLYLSESTVKYHAGQIMEKLGADSRSAALAEATRRGWIERRKRV